MTSKMSQFGYSRVIAFLDLVKPKMKKINMYIFCSKLQIAHYLEWAKREKLKYDLLIWDKGLRGLKSTKFYGQDIEYIIRIYENGVSLKRIVSSDGKAKVDYYHKSQKFSQPKGKHETMKPVELISRYIELSSNENEVVLDPFMGSGTTGIACKNLDREFIGIEIDENYYEIAKERIENMPVQMNIFDYIGEKE